MKQKLSPYRNINAFIRKGEKYYVAECVEIGVVTQGKTVDETIANLREAVALHLENFDFCNLHFDFSVRSLGSQSKWCNLL